MKNSTWSIKAGMVSRPTVAESIYRIPVSIERVSMASGLSKMVNARPDTKATYAELYFEAHDDCVIRANMTQALKAFLRR